MNKTFRLALGRALCILFFSFSVSIHAEDKPAPASANPKKPAKVSEVKPAVVGLLERYKGIKNPPHPVSKIAQLGEKLVYLAKWNGVPAGTVTLKVWPTKRRMRKKKVYMFELRSESNDFLTAFYPVNTVVTSFADADTGTSYLFRRNIREGRYRANDRLQFDYENMDDAQIAAPVSRYFKIKNEEAVAKEPRPIPGQLQDALSIVYYMRHFKFNKVGDEYKMLMGTRKNTTAVLLTAKRFEKLTIANIGTFNCVVIEPKGDENADPESLAKVEGRALVWLEKNTNIPLMVSVNIPIGRATATLMSHEKSGLEKHRSAPVVDVKPVSKDLEKPKK